MTLINGQQSEDIQVTDRGLQYGDGVFETISVIKGRPRLLDKHLDRLKNACERIKIPYPGNSLLKKELGTLCNNQAINQIVKIIVTRGSGGRGYKPASGIEASRILSSYPWPDFPQAWQSDGVNVRICQQPLSMNATLAGIKHLNRLEQVLASMEWDDPNIAEGIMFDTEGNAIEGTKTNLFVISHKEIYTPDLGQCGVKGIMRDLIMNLASTGGIKVLEKKLTLEDLYNADEVLLCNSVIGLWPVKQIEQHNYSQDRPVGNLLKQLLMKQPGFDEGIPPLGT